MISLVRCTSLQRFVGLGLMQSKTSWIAADKVGTLCIVGSAGRRGIYTKERASRLLALTFSPAPRQQRTGGGFFFGSEAFAMRKSLSFQQLLSL